MITGPLKGKIDKLWTEFWTGGITNPLTVIEQITYLMFARLLDMREAAEAAKHNRVRPGEPFPGRYFKPSDDPARDERPLRWSNWDNKEPGKMLELVRDRVFPHMKAIADRENGEGTAFGRFMKDAQFMIAKPNLLFSAVGMIDDLPLGRSDMKGDLYEHLLGKLTTAGINGQFRTPGHIIQMMVELAEPKTTDVVADPACGTGGFLVGVSEYILKTHSSDLGVDTRGEGMDRTMVYLGDELSPEERDHLRGGMLAGFDFDATMLRIAAMNLMLHGVDRPVITYRDTLSGRFDEENPAQAANAYDVILANPPFKGSLDYGDVSPSLLGVVKTKKTELLFLARMLRMLKEGGRCCVVVPDGVLFGSSKAHKAVREELVERHQLEAVIDLPGGVFKPYAGVSTAVLLFTKGGTTGDVFFYGVADDGFTLDDKRTRLGDDPDDYRDVTNAPKAWAVFRDAGRDAFDGRAGKAFWVPKDEIAGNDYSLSFSRYHEPPFEEEDIEEADVLLKKLRSSEVKAKCERRALEGVL